MHRTKKDQYMSRLSLKPSKQPQLLNLSRAATLCLPVSPTNKSKHSMGFFDLNIPYPEPSPSNTNTKHSIEANRTKTAVMALEVGYSGIAYNRTIKGVMSDHHRCSIVPLSLSSLLKVLPSLSLSAKLHRDLLGTPLSTPFRQYTRLTVVVDTPIQAQALNSGNPILKTYDLVAVRPTHQFAFDMACQRMEVDIVSIDFTVKLQFRLKQSMVTAATQRGVYFEVTYSGLFADNQSRRHLISAAKLLMQWTGGRNVIFSSAAPSVNEFRGPCDVANLLSILGLSNERAKEVISKNCRSLLANALRKKRFYKEAIRIERLSSDAASHPKEDQYQELLKWDPISSEGDILLDDLAKSFSSPSKASKTAKAIDFISVVDSIQSDGFQAKDFLPASNAFPVSPNNNGKFLPVEENVSQSTPVLNNSTEQPNGYVVCPEQDESLVCDPIATHQVVTTMTMTTTKSFPTKCNQLHGSSDTLVICDKFFEKNRQSATTETRNSQQEMDTPINATEIELKNSIDLDVDCPQLEAKARDSQCHSCASSITLDNGITYENEKLHEPSDDAKLDDGHNVDHKIDFFTPSMDTISPLLVHDEHDSGKSSDVNLNAKITKMHKGPRSEDLKIAKSTVLEINTSISETPYDEMKMEDDSAVATFTLPDVIMEDQNLGEVSTKADKVAPVQSVSGRRRVKRRTPRGALLLPIMRLLNPISFKKKGKIIDSRTKLKEIKKNGEKIKSRTKLR